MVNQNSDFNLQGKGTRTENVDSLTRNEPIISDRKD